MTVSTLNLATITADHFNDVLGTTFDLALDEELATVASVLLNKITEYPDSYSVSTRSPFSLVFVGPKDRRFNQRIYFLTSAILGTLDLFLVPIGIAPDGILYEAVFN